MEYSKYQLDVFDWTKHGSGHAAVNAVAGSGKTFTGVQNLENVEPYTAMGLQNRVVFTCFNKDIQETLEQKVKHLRNVDALTYNSLGWRACRANLRGHEITLQGYQGDGHKSARILRSILGQDADFETYCKVAFPIQRLVSLLKGQCVFSVEEAAAAVPALLDFHDLDVPGADDKPCNFDKFMDLLLAVYSESIRSVLFMDFDDQIFQPLMRGWKLPQYDWVFVDEYQDTNDMQDRFMRGCLKRDGRMCVFGDPDQAIYEFRGATPAAMDLWMARMSAVQLPLSICYRCPRSVVEEAKKIVPRIEAAPGAGAGFFGTVTEDRYWADVGEDDFVICRTTARLVSDYLKFIADGRRANVRGKDIGDRLLVMVNQVTGGERLGISLFYDMLDAHVQKKAEEWANRDHKLEELGDRAACLRACAGGCADTDDLKLKVNSLFTDAETSGITLMTCHKSKGLQNPRVWVRDPEKLYDEWRATRDWMRGSQRRLRYVTYTRAQEGLMLVVPRN